MPVRFVAAVLLLLVVAVVPARAHTDACVFHGAMYTAFPPSTPQQSVPYMLVATVAACVPSLGTFQATGDIVGFLPLTTGTGVTTTGHRFAFTGSGGVVAVAGEVVGVLEIVPAQGSFLCGSACNVVHGTLAIVNGPTASP